jgi:hypothetical protein
MSIQKVLKGWSISKKFEPFYIKMRLTDNLEHFDKYNAMIKENAQILIAYHWKKKLKKMRELGNAKNQPKRKKSFKKVNKSKVRPYIDGKMDAGSLKIKL